MIPSQLEDEVIQVVKEVIIDWDSADSIEITASTLLVKDLDFESLDVVRLVAALEQHFSIINLPIEKLFLREDHFADEISVSDVVSFLKTTINS